MRSTSYNQISAGGNKLEQPLLARYYAKPQKRPECLCITKRNASLCKYAVPAKPQLKVIAAWMTLSIELLISSVVTEQKQTFISVTKECIFTCEKKDHQYAEYVGAQGMNAHDGAFSPPCSLLSLKPCAHQPQSVGETQVASLPVPRASPLPHQCVWEGLFYIHWSMDYFRLLPMSLSNP